MLDKENKILASILSSENRALSIRKLIEKDVKWIHYDVMDGEFVNNYQLPFLECEKLIYTSKKHNRDFHFMVTTPYDHIAAFIEIGNIFTIHYESVTKYEMERILNDFDYVNIGIAINPGTEVEKLYPYLQRISHVLIMSVEPGRGGQKFLPNTFDKIKKLNNKRQEDNWFAIGVDGGIDDQNAKQLYEVGANYLVSGSFLLNNLDRKTISRLKGN